MRDESALSRFGRLTKRSEFVAAASGRRFHTERVTVQGLLRDDGRGLRFGITVTKRVGHATERNRIRRRLRAAIRSAAPPDPSRDIDVVVIGRRDVLTAPHPILVEDVERALAAVAKPKRTRPDPVSSLIDGQRRGISHA